MKQKKEHDDCELVKKFISNLREASKAENTIIGYSKDIRKLFEFFHLNDENISKINSLTVSDYREFYSSFNISDNSKNGLIRNLDAVFLFLIEEGLTDRNNAFYQVKFDKNKSFIKVPRKKKVILTDEEANMLVAAGRNLQEKFMLKLMLVNGLRRDEICEIKISDINGCTISIKSKGGNEDDETYLNDDLCQMLNDYMLERDSDSLYLFYGTRGSEGKVGKLSGSSVNNRVKECLLLSGIPEDKVKVTTAHRLRAYSITKMYLKKGKEAAQALARHKNGNTTDLYIVVGNEFVKELLLGKQE